MEDQYFTAQSLREAVDYWDKRAGTALAPERLREAVEAYIRANNTCALATGSGDYVRCTPIEYSYRDGCFWMFSEGGKKFLGLSQNANVSLAIYDKYEGFGKLYSVQVTGKARLVPPSDPDYAACAAARKIPLSALRTPGGAMHLICVRPTRMDCLFSDFKTLGCSPRQTLLLEE